MAQLQAARLIPISGINNDTEAEARATSALLAVLTVVRDLSAELLSPHGASGAQRAQVDAYIEPRFKLNGSTIRPDGLISVAYGKTTWKCLVEVKTGTNRLGADQVNAYWDVAREYGFDHVLTISNELGIGGGHPTDGLRVRSNSPVQVSHLSWTEILTAAVKCKVHQGVDDPEQAYILGELIRYLEHEASGALAFDDMGPSWVTVRDGGRNGSLRRGDEAAHDIAERWDQLIRYASLRLGADTGADVQHVLPRGERDPKVRIEKLLDRMCADGVLDGAVRVPNTAGDLSVSLDLRARQAVTSMQVDAPSDKGARGSVGWLVRQLSEAPPDVVVGAYPKKAKIPVAASLAQLREDRDAVIDADKREVNRFELTTRGEAGKGRKGGGRSPGVIDTVLDQIDRFYAEVVQRITPYQPRAPKAREERPPEREPELGVESRVVTSRADLFGTWGARQIT